MSYKWHLGQSAGGRVVGKKEGFSISVDGIGAVVLSSRCALESSGSAACPQVPPGERESSQLMYPQSSVSRLTYVSERDSSWPTTASDRGLEDRKVGTLYYLSTQAPGARVLG